MTDRHKHELAYGGSGLVGPMVFPQILAGVLRLFRSACMLVSVPESEGTGLPVFTTRSTRRSMLNCRL